MSSSEQWLLRGTPRYWQREALDLWKQHLRGIVQVVTGGGKTFFAQMCMLAFREFFPNTRFIIVVPTTALLDQWFVSLQEGLGLPESSIACFSGEEKPSEFKEVNILVLNSARVIAPLIANTGDTCLIVDECHRSGSPVNSLALAGNHQGTLGLSATPEREYDQGFQERISPVLGDVIYSYDYTQAAVDGIISKFDLVNIRVPLLAEEAKEYDRVTKLIHRAIHEQNRPDHEDYVDRVKKLLLRRSSVSSQAVMRVPVTGKLIDLHRGQRAIVFHERLSKIDALYKVLVARHHSVTTYHTGVGPILRRDNLRLYRQGVFDVILSCRSLDEGVNVPEAEIAVIASSTASIRQRIQRLGRVLRPAPGKEQATIYTIYATDQEERRLLLEAERLAEVTSVTWQQGGYQIHG